MMVKGTLGDTDHDHYKSQLEDLDKQRQEKEFVSIKLKGRNKGK